MSDSFDVTTIIFAALALFVVWKLRSVLGTRTGHERKPDLPPRSNGQQPAADDGKVVRLPGAAAERRQEAVPRQRDEARWEGLAERGSPVWQGLDAIASADASFDGREFLEGAKSAYEMIIGAFASGDRQTLKSLLAKDVYDSFAQAITDRENAVERVETTFVSIDKAKIDEAQVKAGSIQVTVSFVSKLITATFDRNNKIVDGNPEKITDVADVWTFARDAGSNDPNWLLVAT